MADACRKFFSCPLQRVLLCQRGQIAKTTVFQSEVNNGKILAIYLVTPTSSIC